MVKHLLAAVMNKGRSIDEERAVEEAQSSCNGSSVVHEGRIEDCNIGGVIRPDAACRSRSSAVWHCCHALSGLQVHSQCSTCRCLLVRAKIGRLDGYIGPNQDEAGFPVGREIPEIRVQESDCLVPDRDRCPGKPVV